MLNLFYNFDDTTQPQLRKCLTGYKLSISHNDIILLAKNLKKMETLIHTVRIYSKEFCIEKITKLGERTLQILGDIGT